MEGLDKLKKERKQVRRLFTKAYNELEDLLNNEELPFSSKETHMKASFSAIEGKIDNLMVLDVEIKNLLIVGDTDDTQLDVEYDSQEEYQKKWFFIKAKYEKMLNASTSSKNGELVSQRHKRYFHLPKLELQLFDGNIKNWIGFWGQFKKVHEDKEIEPEDKFQYLIQSMTPGSSAREIVESFPPSGENYVKAIKQLKSRFARDEFLIEVYVRELLNLVLQQATKMNNMPLSSLSDKLETQLRALETLGVTSDKYAAMLYPLVESALPDETLKAWERYRTSNKIGLNEFKASTESVNSSNNVNYLQLLLNFLRSEVESEERLTLARTSFAVDRDLISKDNHTRKPKGQPRTQREFEKGLPTASTILATDSSVAGPELLKKAGGLHKFMGWNRSLLTDSGGFQMVSLLSLAEITEDGVKFQSPYGAQECMLTPEQSIDIQTAIGADIIMQLDDVIKTTSTGPRVEEATYRTTRWLDRCLEAHKNTDKQNLFPIVQGVLVPELRVESARLHAQRNVPGFAVGGLSGGEAKDDFWRMVHLSTDTLPRDRPIYLMGVGFAVDLVICVALGIDMFDCVFPTRTARFGCGLVLGGQINLKHKKYAQDYTPIEEGCDCSTCKTYTRAYLHCIVTVETVACHLLTVHNVAFQMRLMRNMRESIKEDRFPQFVCDFMKKTFVNEPYPEWVVNALTAVNVQLDENKTTSLGMKHPSLDEELPSQRVKVVHDPS